MALVGTASVKIVADTSGLYADISKQLSGLDKVAKRSGMDMGNELRAGIIQGMGNADTMFAAPSGKAAQKGREAGTAFGKGFATGAIPHFKALSTALGRTFGADMANQASQGFASNLKIGGVVEQQLEQAGRQAERSLQQHVADGISDGAERGSRQASRSMSGAMGMSAGRRDGNAYGAGFSSALSKWKGSRKGGPFEAQIAGFMENLIPLQMMQGVMAGVASAAASAAGGVISLASALVYAAPAALQFANVLGAAIQGMVVFKSLMSGVGEGISAYKDSTNQSTKATNTASKASKNHQKELMSEEERLLRIREARDALNDAIIEGARANEDAIEAVSDAQESLSDAVEDSTDAQEAYTDALESQSDAQRDLADAITDEKKALDDLNEARAEAEERLEDLALDLERASLNEERAALNLRKAEEELANARAGGNANAIYEADLAYREQLQTVKELQESNGDLRDEANKANSEGVDGNQDVIDAQRAYRDAIEATSDAQEALSDAIEGVSDAQEGMRDAVEATSDAQRELARAMEDVPRIAEDASIRIARAQLNLKKALEDTGDAATGMGDAMGGAAGGAAKMETAFDKLNPVVQDFVRFIVDDFLPPFEEIKELGQEEFFPRLTEAMQSIIDNNTLMEMLKKTYVETSIVLGDFTINLANAFQTPESMKAFQTILDSNVVILENLLTAATNLVQPLSQIFEATAPLAEAWSESVVNATNSFKDFIAEQAKAPVGGGQSPLEQFFAHSAELAGTLWELIKNIGSSLMGVFEAALPAGEWFLEHMVQKTEGWKTSIDEAGLSLEDFFWGATNNLASIMDLVGAIALEFLKLGDNPMIGEIARAAKELVPILGALAEDGFNQIAPAILRVIEAIEPMLTLFAESGTIKAFADAIARTVEIISGLVELFMSWGGSDETLKVVGWLVGTGAALSTIVGLGTKVVDKLNGIWGSFKTGKDMVKGAVDALGNFTTSMKNFSSRQKAGKKAEQVALDDYWAGGLTDSKGNKKTQAGADASARKAGKDTKNKMKAEQAMDSMEKDLKKAAEKEAREIQKIGESLGLDLSEGLEKGLEKSYPELMRAAKKMGLDVIETLADALGTHSMSDKTFKQGQDTAEGVEKGLEKGTREAVEEAEQLGDKVIRELKSGMADGGDDAGDAAVNALEKSLQQGQSAVNDEIRDLVNGAERAAEGMDPIDLDVEVPEATAINDDIRDIIRDAEGVAPDLNLKVEVPEATAINDDVRDIIRDAENVAPDLDLNVDIPAKEKTDVAAELTKLVNDVEVLAPEIDVKADIPEYEKAALNAEAQAMVATAEARAGVINVGVRGRWLGGAGRGRRARAGGGGGVKASKKGGRVDADGNAIDKKGRRVNDKGDWVDNDGNVVDSKGRRVDADGNIIDGKKAGKKGKGVKAVGGKAVKKKGIGKAASKALAVLPVPGARIAAGALTAGIALNTLGERAKEGMTEAEIAAMSTWDTIGLGWSTLWQGAEDIFSTFFSETLPNWWNNTVVPWWHEIWADVGQWWSDLWQGCWDAIVKFFSEDIPNWWNTSVVPWWHSIWAGLGQGWSDLWRGAWDTLVKFFTEDIPNWWNGTVVPWWNGIWEDLGQGWSDTWNGVWDKLQSLWNDTIWPWITGIPERIKQKLKDGFDSFSQAFQDAWDSIKGLWNNTIWPWITGIPGRIKQKLTDAFDSFSQGFQDAWNSITGLWNNTIWPWIKSIPTKIGNELKKAFNGLVEGFDSAMSGISGAWNKAMGALEKLPFVDSLPRWTYTKIGGYAEGGEVQGPDRGPKADNVLAALTPGEYVLTRKMVQQAGVENLEAWRRGGAMSARGGGRGGDLGEKVSGAWSTAKNWTKEKLDTMKDMAKEGALKLVTPILKVVSETFPNRKYLQKFIDWLISGGPMKTWTDGLTEKAKATEEQRIAEEEAAAAAAGGGAPYTGPPGGWTHPLGGKGNPATYPGHSNTGAYDWAVPSGTPIVAVNAGNVIISKDLQGSYGKYVKIRHKSDTSLYAHMSTRIAKSGQVVKTGQVIGKVGSTGNSTGPHLHLEISPPKNTVSVLKSHGVKMAKGGIVPAIPGGMLALIGEGGRSERVTPLDNQGRSATEVEMLEVLKSMAAQRAGGGDTFNVFPAPGMSERELASRVSRQVALTHRRRS